MGKSKKKKINKLQIDESKVKLDTNDFESEFSKKEIKKKVAAPKLIVSTKKSYLSNEKARCVSVVLQKLGYDKDPIVISDALIEYDEKILTPEACDLLKPAFPKQSEFDDLLKNLEKNQVQQEDLISSDIFIQTVGCILGYQERLDSIIFKNEYKDMSWNILKLIENFYTCFDSIIKNEHFNKFLEIILAHGNYLNGTTVRGGAFGFKLTSLTKIAEMKTKDNKSNLLNYIVEFIIDDLKQPEILDFLSLLKLFKELEIQPIIESTNNLNRQFKKVITLKELCHSKKEELEEGDKTEEFISSFYEHAEKSMNLLQESIDKIHTKYIDVAKFFAETPQTLSEDTFIQIMKTFYNNLNDSMEIYIKMKEARDKKNKRKTKKKF